MTVEAPVRDTGTQQSPSAVIDGIFRTFDAGNVGWQIGTVKPDGTAVTFLDILAGFRKAAEASHHPALAHGSDRQVLARFMQIAQIPGFAAREALSCYDQAFPQQQ